MVKSNDEYEFEITMVDVEDFLSCLNISHKGTKLDQVRDIVKKDNGEYCYDVVMASSVNSSLQVLIQVDASASAFKLLGPKSQEEWIDLSYKWRQLLLNKYKEEYAEYFVYNWEEIEDEYLETVSLIEHYLGEAKKQYDDAFSTYEAAIKELENKSNKR